MPSTDELKAKVSSGGITTRESGREEEQEQEHQGGLRACRTRFRPPAPPTCHTFPFLRHIHCVVAHVCGPHSRFFPSHMGQAQELAQKGLAMAQNAAAKFNEDLEKVEILQARLQELETHDRGNLGDRDWGRRLDGLIHACMTFSLPPSLPPLLLSYRFASSSRTLLSIESGGNHQGA